MDEEASGGAAVALVARSSTAVSETGPAVVSATTVVPLGEFERLATCVRELTEQVEEANRLGQDRERVVDRLHQENQQLRVGELQQALTPVLRDLIRLFDDLQRTAAAYATRAEPLPPEVVRDLECYRDTVLDILYRQGVEPYDAPAEAAFDPKLHRALGSVATSTPCQDRSVARVVRVGFRSEARVIRSLEAEVYRFRDDDAGAKDARPTAPPPKEG